MLETEDEHPQSLGIRTVYAWLAASTLYRRPSDASITGIDNQRTTTTTSKANKARRGTRARATAAAQRLAQSPTLCATTVFAGFGQWDLAIKTASQSNSWGTASLACSAAFASHHLTPTPQQTPTKISPPTNGMTKTTTTRPTSPITRKPHSSAAQYFVSVFEHIPSSWRAACVTLFLVDSIRRVEGTEDEISLFKLLDDTDTGGKLYLTLGEALFSTPSAATKKQSTVQASARLFLRQYLPSNPTQIQACLSFIRDAASKVVTKKLAGAEKALFTNTVHDGGVIRRGSRSSMPGAPWLPGSSSLEVEYDFLDDEEQVSERKPYSCMHVCV